MPPDEATHALRSHMLANLHRKLGGKIGTIAFEALEREPFDPVRAALADVAIDSLAEARAAAFAQAGIPLPMNFGVCVQQKRNEALLAYCRELMQSDSRTAYDRCGQRRAAEELHDRVKTFLDKRGEWPVLSEAEFELNAKPAAIMLLEWQRCGEIAEGSGFSALLRSLIQFK